jgi:SAM-dependent methyltransferase
MSAGRREPCDASGIFRTEFFEQVDSAARMETDYSEVTEIAGAPISAEQLFRLHHRYTWAAGYCRDRDVLECACGTGPGLGLLQRASRSFAAGDISPLMVETARRHYGARLQVSQFSAESLPFADRSLDVVILFEALYYLPDAARFARECARVLRPGGHVLIVTANKDLWDFHPSPYTHRYYGVRELGELLSAAQFECEFFGFQDASRSSLRQRLLRPVKRLAVASGLMPKTMAGKRWLKRLVFGAEVRMPAELEPGGQAYAAPAGIPAGRADERHKIIYCAARLRP